MRKQHGLIIVAMGVVAIFASSGNAQQLVGGSDKPAIDVKNLPRLFDAKSMEDPEAAGKAILQTEKAFEGRRQPEAVRMLFAILRGSQMGPDSGWFAPADSRYQWN